MFPIKCINNNQQALIILAILLLTNLIGCSNSKDSQFENELSKGLNSSMAPDHNARRKKMFERMYNIEKARKKGLEYCQKLASGITKEELVTQSNVAIIELRDEIKLTPEEAADLTIVDISIELAAIKAYCPNYQ